MSEEIKKNEQPQVEEQPKEQEAQKPAPITLSMISKGTLELAVPERFPGFQETGSCSVCRCRCKVGPGGRQGRSPLRCQRHQRKDQPL